MPDTWKQARVLGAFYDRLAEGVAGQTACPQIASFGVCYGWIDTSGDMPQPEEPPFDAESLPGSLVHTGLVTAEPSGKSVLATAVIPEGAVAEPTQVTAIGLFDQTDTLVAAVSFLPEWITPDKRYEHLVHMTFPEE